MTARLLVAAAGLLIAIPLGLILAFTALNGSVGCGQGQDGGIPPDYLQLYQQAGQKYGIPWQVLAGIGKAESDHGRGTGVGIRDGANRAGAMGPMQFLDTTWAAYGVDGNGDGRTDVYDPADAIPSAAKYLKANGAPADMYRAVWRYNHADWYVRRVLGFARGYSSGSAGVGEELCALPAARTAVAGRVLAYARMQLGKPYAWGAEGPGAFDCSGLTMRAYQYAGILLPRVAADQWRQGPTVTRGQEQPGDLVFMHPGAGGPGHVGVVVTPGQMIHAPHTGDVVRYASYSARSDVVGFTRPASLMEKK
ncbi:NlpC/P60 family protein [Microbispora hainanensis]|uniref:NlpC/P60 family protein n=1 Tax=Microbispora hainanensis TaxID=568844 RepID=A0ABZ1SX64_9ACTN|nr:MULTISPECIES: NlpC/P60 family protein [Microbispora]NJP29512.1 transglycosylase SLT domain-containing protein [Microbispora sp. CL1-1]TQS04981.1 hydrolase [Microbispora sp. SCL1-1]